MLRATRRRKTSPVTMPLTPPVGFCNAVKRPILNAVRMGRGMSALARSVAILPIAAVSASDSRKGRRRWSAVIPDGPPATPRFAYRMFREKPSTSRLRGDPGWNSSTSAGIGSRGSAGLFDGSRRASNVFQFPGATGAPSRH